MVFTWTLLTNSFTDVDPLSVPGIAITAAEGASGGAWEYRADADATWTAVGSVSENGALLLPDTYSVRYVPNQQTGENPGATTYYGWDQYLGTLGARESVTERGGGTAFSLASDTAIVFVEEINDAPTTSTASSSGNEGEEITVTLSAQDVDATSAADYTFTVLSPPEDLTVEDVTLSEPVLNDGTIQVVATYTHHGGEQATDSFTLRFPMAIW